MQCSRPLAALPSCGSGGHVLLCQGLLVYGLSNSDCRRTAVPTSVGSRGHCPFMLRLYGNVLLRAPHVQSAFCMLTCACPAFVSCPRYRSVKASLHTHSHGNNWRIDSRRIIILRFRVLRMGDANSKHSVLDTRFIKRSQVIDRCGISPIRIHLYQ